MASLNLIRANVNSERGAAMVEYAFLVILIAIIAFVGVQIAGQQVSLAFSTVADGFTNPN
jgi:Flp pilus assembly pilin Flp